MWEWHTSANHFLVGGFFKTKSILAVEMKERILFLACTVYGNYNEAQLISCVNIRMA